MGNKGNRPHESVIRRRMPLNAEQFTKPVRKLRKFLRKCRNVPTPDQIHNLRAQSRRVEATLQAVGSDQTKSGRHLLKSITPIRKRAGKVRDMDVLTELASQLVMENRNSDQRFGEAPVQLLQHLGRSRFGFAKRLEKVVASKRKSALKRLKRFAHWTDRRLKGMGRPSAKLARWQTDPTATAIYMSSSLAEWPRLDRENLHAFRLRVKQLRYVLQLASNPDGRLVDALGSVKDAIGEWHDWCELETITRQSIPGNDEFCDRIHSIAEDTFDRALTGANQLRHEYFDGAPEQHGRRRSRSMASKNPVLISAAQMSA